MMRKNGYFTGFAGKFGFELELELENEDHSDKFCDLPVSDFDVWGGAPGQSCYKTGVNEYLKQYADEYPHIDRALGAFSRDLAVTKDKPFCLSISFKAPHAGHQKIDDLFEDQYKNQVFPVPPNYGENGTKAIAHQSTLGRQRQGALRYTVEEVNAVIANYYRQISGVDAAVAMIREELEAQEIADNTVIIFTSDNGYFLGVHQFMGKSLLYEDGTHVPMVIYDPRNSVTHGQRTQGISSGIDISPTILGLAGIKPPEGINGTSLLPVLDDKEHRVRKHLLQIQLYGGQGAGDPNYALGIVSEDYRYNYWFHGTEAYEPTEELFSRKNDRYEFTELSENPEYAPIIDEMQKEYQRNLDLYKQTRIAESAYDRIDTLADQNISWRDKKWKAYKDLFAPENQKIKKKKN